MNDTIINAVGTLVSPITKLVDAFCGACGKIYEPIHIKRVAKAKAYELKTIGDAIEGNNNVLVQAYNNGMIQIDNKDLNNLTVRAISRTLYQETVKQQNVESVIQKTAILLEDEPSVTAEPVDQDWMTRFINSVETISDEDLQFLWAKVLAGEIKKPKCYSLRTLETLKNLSKEEALLFQDLSSYVIKKDNDYYFINDTHFKNSKTELYKILQLSDCGLVNDASLLGMTYNILPKDKIYFANNNIIIMCQNNNEEEKVMHFGVYLLTSVGRNLINIINKDTDNNFILEFGKFLKQRNDNLNITAYKIINYDLTSDQITFDPQVNLLD